MNGKHVFGCDCRDCMTYLGTHIDEWMPEYAVLARAERLADAGNFTRAILARADLSADAQNFLSSLNVPIDDVFDLTPPVTIIRDVCDVDADIFLTPTTSTVTTTTTILTTPQKTVKRRSVSPVRAGDKLDFLRYQSPVKKKAVPVGVVSPSIKDTLRRVYPPTVKQEVRFPVPEKKYTFTQGLPPGFRFPITTPRRKVHPPDTEDYFYSSDGTKRERSQWVKDVMRRVCAAEAAREQSEKEMQARLHEAEAARLYDVEQEQSKKARHAKCHALKAAFKAKVKSELME